MSSNSRTKNSLTNIKVSLSFYFINLILQFFLRKILLDKLGLEVLGLNTTALNLLQFLNLAELGIGASVSYSLYRPLADKNYSYVSNILSLQGFLYKKVGYIVLAAGIILSTFFPFIFSNMQLPLWYAYATFGVLFLSALMGYFFNYHQILLISDQKEYKLNYVLQGIKVAKILIQILSINFLTHGYIWWIFWELIALLFTTFGINKILRNEYPWLEINNSNGKILLSTYPEIVNKTKQLIAHKLAGFTLNETTPLIIFSFSSLSFIAIYGNYILIITGISGLLAAVFNSMNASVGNLVSEAHTKKVKIIFEELFAARFFLGVVFCYSTYKLAPFFIINWMGDKYLLEQSTLLLLVVLMFINITRLTVDSFINAYGLFSDTLAPTIELITNISLSIFLGYFFGINGVLIGALTSSVVIVLVWKPYFLFRRGLNIDPTAYFSVYVKQLGISVFVIFICEYLLKFVLTSQTDQFFKFVICCVFILTISMILFFLFYFFISGMQNFIDRLKKKLVNG